MSSHQQSTTDPEVHPSSITDTYTGGSVVTTGEAFLMILIALFLVFFVVIVLYFRAKYSRAGSIDEHLPLTRSRSPLVLAPDSRTRARRHRRPLDPSILKALPVSVFPSEDFKLKGVAGVEYSCAVCLSEFADGEEARVLPRCRHGFHVECIDMWFHSNSTCPLCRLLVALAPSPACAEVVSCKIVDPESTCVVNIDEGSSSLNSSPSPSSSSACSTLRRVLSRGGDMLAGACNVSRGSDIEEGVLCVPVPNSSM